MWQVLFYVNPTTIAVVLALCLAAAAALAWWRHPDPARFRRPVRVLLAVAGAVYLAVLAAPVGGTGVAESGDRAVVWDPMLSFRDIPGFGEPSGPRAGFGRTLEDGRTVWYAPEEAPLAERTGEGRGEDGLYVHDTPDGDLAVTDAEGGPAPQEEAALAERVVTEELTRNAEYEARLAAEGPWGTSGGLALQERTLNTLLFVPVGVLAFFAFGSWTARVLFGPGLSLTVEAAQWALPWNRMADTGDLLVNSAGSVAGTLFALAAVGAVAVARPGGAAGTGAGGAPSDPPHGSGTDSQRSRTTPEPTSRH
ncbi:hypothetical protein GCM10007079_42460 [Nocardiopsis terrae]|uniref:VanZ-like domain-containing protein n=1 Tax=Nocardiopsis terrae TaxID=372655 RepID=A0ABR9HLN7_9ACTN|nr:VanZ family protein [Nocardiopsis terrae]MBE1459937.1 hypothetical protein [Nocardiopsis terrae]GHC93251.1 hypothetical protein GCM10007079_42460 [Nocardiopsis terrae]